MTPAEAVIKTLTQVERFLLEERAGIMEFDGKVSRKDAEESALWDVVKGRKRGKR